MDRLLGLLALVIFVPHAQVRDPRLVFLDEPTSGLDSDMATQVMDTLTRIARRDRLVRRVLLIVEEPFSLEAFNPECSATTVDRVQVFNCATP
jgi:ABC-type dipeptide/oligopeptide/nickel transport system ATPase component